MDEVLHCRKLMFELSFQKARLNFGFGTSNKLTGLQNPVFSSSNSLLFLPLYQLSMCAHLRKPEHPLKQNRFFNLNFETIWAQHDYVHTWTVRLQRGDLVLLLGRMVKGKRKVNIVVPRCHNSNFNTVRYLLIKYTTQK